jgi:hypothetical protein
MKVQRIKLTVIGEATTTAYGAQQAFWRGGARVSNAPIPVIRRRSADRPNRQPMVTRVHHGMIRREPTRSANESDA